MMIMHQIMLVDDEENILSSLSRILKREAGLKIVTHSDPCAALAEANRSKFDLFLSDYRMPYMDGVEFLVNTKEHNPDAMRLILSGAADFSALMDAINRAEIYRFISKPIQVHELIQTLRHALHLHEITEENKRLSDLVREQQNELKNRDLALKNFSQRHPALADVHWEDDGSISIDEDDT
jgi:DNA-binding NtrC family response regulator